MGRLVFMGSPEFALPSLQRLLDQGHEVALVLSRPDQRAGRGRGWTPTAVSAFARERGLPLETPERLRESGLKERLRALDADLFVVVAYRILPPSLLEIPRLGSINLHGSLLPWYRGAAPIERALLDGAPRTGLTTFLLERGVDTGRVLDSVELEIGPDETAGELRARMRQAGAPLLSASVAAVLEGRAQSKPQPEGEFPLAPKLGPADRLLDFTQAAAQLHNRVRALSPEPGALALFRGQPLQVLRTRLVAEPVAGDAGQLRVRAKRLYLACGSGELELLELMPAGKNRMPVQAWLAGARLGESDRLEAITAPSTGEST
jgi:methionyl-tRNA formyltransferase